MGAALGTLLAVGLFAEVLDDARLAEGVKALVDRMGVPEESVAE